jgi:tetratricopeptide (TPR) repeat protein
MKFIVSIIIVTLALASCKTNNYLKYHRIVNEAEYSFFNEDYKTASELYTKAFKKVPTPFEDDMYYLSASLWEIGEFDQSIALLDTLPDLESKLTESGFYQGMDPALHRDLILKNWKRRTLIIERYANDPLIAVMDSVVKRDLKARDDYFGLINAGESDSLTIEAALQEFKATNARNLTTIDSLFSIHGYLGGVYYPRSILFNLTVLSLKTDWVYNHPDQAKKAIKQGRLLPGLYANAYDRAMLYYTKDTLVRYGQYTSYLNGVSPEEVFEDAKKIGVSPYFDETIHFPTKKGRQPQKHLYYDYYKTHKDRFNCY